MVNVLLIIFLVPLSLSRTFAFTLNRFDNRFLYGPHITFSKKTYPVFIFQQNTRNERLFSYKKTIRSCSEETGKDREGGGGDLPMGFLQQRIAEMQSAEVIKDRKCAKNWSEGRCSTRAVAVLEDDWIRQVREVFHIR